MGEDIGKVVMGVLAAVVIAGACSSGGNSGAPTAQTRENIGKVADEALEILQKEAAALGEAKVTDLRQQIKPYSDAVGAAGNLVVERAKGLNDDEFWVFVLSAFRWMGLSASMTSADEKVSLKALVEDVADDKSDPDPTELQQDARRFLTWAAQLAFYNEKQIMDQLAPADSLLRKEYDQDGDGRINVQLPPIGVPSSTDGRWTKFDDAIADSSDSLSVARAEIGLAAAQPEISPSG